MDDQNLQRPERGEMSNCFIVFVNCLHRTLKVNACHFCVNAKVIFKILQMSGVLHCPNIESERTFPG